TAITRIESNLTKLCSNLNFRVDALECHSKDLTLSLEDRFGQIEGQLDVLAKQASEEIAVARIESQHAIMAAKREGANIANSNGNIDTLKMITATIHAIKNDISVVSSVN